MKNNQYIAIPFSRSRAGSATVETPSDKRERCTVHRLNPDTRKIVNSLIVEFPKRSKEDIIKAVTFCNVSFKAYGSWIQIKECAKQLLREDESGVSSQEWTR